MSNYTRRQFSYTKRQISGKRLAPKCIDGSVCRLEYGCLECDSNQLAYHQLRNLMEAGLRNTPKHWRLNKATYLSFNDWHAAMSRYRDRQLYKVMDSQLFLKAHVLLKSISTPEQLPQEQVISWEQFTGVPPPVLIMYRSFIAQTATNNDPPRATQGNRRELYAITCAGHC